MGEPGAGENEVRWKSRYVPRGTLVAGGKGQWHLNPAIVGLDGGV
jgi:hypothetical protein